MPIGKNKVTILNPTHKKLNPIPREPNDNTADLEQAEFRAHQEFKHFKAPDRKGNRPAANNTGTRVRPAVGGAGFSNPPNSGANGNTATPSP